MTATTKKKYVEQELFEDYSLPEENQSIVRIVRPRGNNLHQVKAANAEEFIASMPPKFRKHVWIKRGDYVVTEPIPEGNKVRAEIVRILMKDQIRYIVNQGKWPSEFALQDNENKEKNLSDTIQISKVEDENFKDGESGSDDDYSEDDLLMENPNRPGLYCEESETSESESDDSDSESNKSHDDQGESDEL